MTTGHRYPLRFFRKFVQVIQTFCIYRWTNFLRLPKSHLLGTAWLVTATRCGWNSGWSIAGTRYWTSMMSFVCQDKGKFWQGWVLVRHSRTIYYVLEILRWDNSLDIETALGQIQHSHKNCFIYCIYSAFYYSSRLWLQCLKDHNEKHTISYRFHCINPIGYIDSVR